MKRLFLGLFLFIAAVDVYGMKRFDSSSAVADMFKGYVSSQGENGFHLLSSMLMNEEALAEITEKCLEKRIGDVDLKRPSDGRTPLHCATASGKEKLVNLFLESGKKDLVNEKDDNEQTALHIAVSGKSVSLVHQLLAQGANPSLLDNRKKRPVTHLVESALHNKPVQLAESGEKSWHITAPIMQSLCTFMGQQELLEELDYARQLSETNDLKKANRSDYKQHVIDVLEMYSKQEADKDDQQKIKDLAIIKDHFVEVTLQEKLAELRHTKKTTSQNTDYLDELLLAEPVKSQKKSLSAHIGLSDIDVQVLKSHNLTEEDYLLHIDQERQRMKKAGHIVGEPAHTFVPVSSQNGVIDYSVEPRMNTTNTPQNTQNTRNTRNARKLNQSYPAAVDQPLVASPAKKKLNQSDSGCAMTTSNNTNNTTVSNTIPNVLPVYTRIVTRGSNLTVISDIQTGQTHYVPTQQEIPIVSDQEFTFVDESKKYSEAASENQGKKRARNRLEDFDNNQSRKKLREDSKVLLGIRTRQAEGYRNNERPLQSTMKLFEETKHSGEQNE